jgi:hypothetical protein
MPNVSLVVLNLVSLQELPVLVLKRDLAVVLLLSQDVTLHLPNMRLTD